MNAGGAGAPGSIYRHQVTLLGGEHVSMQRYRGRVLLIVNTASRCGYTPQYAELESLYRELSPRGFDVLAFPCNQFGGQEPGTPQEIDDFCRREYQVSFPLHAKIDVNGSLAHPLFIELKDAAPGFLGTRGIKWNFTKFLVDRQGRVVARFGSTTHPKALKERVVALLDAS